MTKIPERVEALDRAREIVKSHLNFPPDAVSAGHYDNTDVMICTLAALAALPEAPAVPVGVKRLEWQEPTSQTNGCWTAKSPLGTYSVVNEGGWYASRDDAPRDFYFEWCGEDMSRDTLETAQAAAQADFEARIRSALVATPPAPTAAVEGDRPETVEHNPKSWIAWKRKAEELQATIDDMWTQFDRLRDATNRPKCGQAFMVGGGNIAPWGIVDHAISALDLSMMRGDRILDQQREIDRLSAKGESE